MKPFLFPIFFFVFAYGYGQSKDTSQDSLYTKPEIEPQFKGGMPAYIAFIKQHLTYPKKAANEGITGKVVVEFVVEKDGTITSPRLVNSLGYGCDEEVLRIVKLMPPWEPGQVDNHPVRAWKTLPVVFKIAK